jgi:hypothetical protein
MEYYKFHIDEDDAKLVYCEYRDLSKGKSAPLLIRSFPLEVIADKESKLYDMVEGDITDVYYEEFNNEVRASEIKWFLGDVEKNSDEDVDWIKNFVKCACVNEDYDDLVAPPSVDQQVEDFIKEFFEDDSSNQNSGLQPTPFADDDLANLDNEKPLDQKDFLAEFFAELEEDTKED